MRSREIGVRQIAHLPSGREGSEDAEADGGGEGRWREQLFGARRAWSCTQRAMHSCDAARSVSFCSFVPVKLVHVGPRGRSARMTS